MLAVYDSYSHLSVPPCRRPWRELAGTILSPKNKLPGIARHENGQQSNSKKVSYVSPYKSLENRAICHPQNREEQNDLGGGRGCSVGKQELAQEFWVHVVHRCGVFVCPCGAIAPTGRWQSDVSSRCPEWIDKSGSEGRKRKLIDSVSHPIP